MYIMIMISYYYNSAIVIVVVFVALPRSRRIVHFGVVIERLKQRRHLLTLVPFATEPGIQNPI